MSLLEYKVITSGKGGFATPALLEKFLNDLGRAEWEIVDYQSQPDNFLAFTGLARRSTQRDWTLEDAAAAAAKVESDKLRAEFEAKFKSAAGGGSGAGAAEESSPSFLEEKAAPDDGFRKPVDTSRDDDPDAPEDDGKSDDWDKLTVAEEDELPTFFDAIKPHMRRNQRGPGMSVGVDYLAKKWDRADEDVKGALAECGFVVPTDEDAKPEYLEYEGDLYWLNLNRRGELWINTKEKPRPIFRAVKAQKVVVEEEVKTEGEGRPGEDRGQRAEGGGQKADEAPGSEPKTQNPRPETAPAAAGVPLPEGADFLAKIRPLMRRNRRGPGGSGSTSFLSRALQCTEADLAAKFAALGLVVPANPADKPVMVEIGNEIWWLNADSRGGLWINGREKKRGETAASANAAERPMQEAPSSPAPVAATSSATEATEVVPPPVGGQVLAGVRLLLKATKTGAVAGKVDRVAEELGKSPDDLVATLIAAGLKAPEKAREKPVFIEQAGEIFWLNRNAKGELWVNAKASKYAEKKSEAGEAPAEGDSAAPGEEKKQARPRGRKKAE